MLLISLMVLWNGAISFIIVVILFKNVFLKNEVFGMNVSAEKSSLTCYTIKSLNASLASRA